MSASIWLPGRGHIDLAATRVNTAVSEYDERLFFGRNNVTGQWCVYVKQEHGEPPLPIIGFDEIPETEVVWREIWKRDALRSGMEIVDSIQRENDRLHAVGESKAQEGEAAALEALAWFSEREAKDHRGTKRFFMGNRRKGNQMGGWR